MDKPLNLHSEPLQTAWLDAYDHLNEAYYLVPMSNATWEVQDYFAIGKDYFSRTSCALYTLESHLRYLHEVRHPALLVVESFIFGSDRKRIWLGHQMWVGNQIVATGEFMLLHFNSSQGKSHVMPESVQLKLKQQQSTLADWVGRKVGLDQG